MNALRVAMAQVNPTLGDLEQNARLVRAHTRKAAAQGAGVVVFGEMALTGYPVEDLALWSSFRQASADTAEHLAGHLKADGLGEVVVVLGALGSSPQGRPTNTAVVLRGGRVQQIYTKQHLPNYGVFDERRIFASGQEPVVIEHQGQRLGIAICEDIWGGNHTGYDAQAGLDALLVLNGSPYERGKAHLRGQTV